MSTNAVVAVTIARQVGAGGATLGQRLAKRLDYLYLDRAILQQVAERIGGNEADLSHWEEHASGIWERITRVFAIGPPEAIYTPPPPLPRMTDRQFFRLEAEIIHKAATEHNVVVIGRGGSWILRKHPGLVSVYLHAPRWARIPEVMQGYNLKSEREAGALIDRMDWDRERFVRQMTREHPGEAQCYHLCIDTHRVGMDLAEEMVVSLVARVRERMGGVKMEETHPA